MLLGPTNDTLSLGSIFHLWIQVKPVYYEKMATLLFKIIHSSVSFALCRLFFSPFPLLGTQDAETEPVPSELRSSLWLIAFLTMSRSS